MMIHKCRSCGWPMEYAEFMAGSPAKCEECGQMQRLGQRPEDPPEGPPEISTQPEVSKATNIFATMAAAVIVLGPIVLCIGLCAGSRGVDTEPYDKRVSVSGLKDFSLDCANDYVRELDRVGVGHFVTYALVERNSISFGTSQQWSRMSKAEKVKTLTVFAQAAIDACPSRFDAKIRMMGLDANGNFSFTYDSPTQIWVND